MLFKSVENKQQLVRALDKTRCASERKKMTKIALFKTMVWVALEVVIVVVVVVAAVSVVVVDETIYSRVLCIWLCTGRLNKRLKDWGGGENKKWICLFGCGKSLPQNELIFKGKWERKQRAK